MPKLLLSFQQRNVIIYKNATKIANIEEESLHTSEPLEEIQRNVQVSHSL